MILGRRDTEIDRYPPHRGGRGMGEVIARFGDRLIRPHLFTEERNAADGRSGRGQTPGPGGYARCFRGEGKEAAGQGARHRPFSQRPSFWRDLGGSSHMAVWEQGPGMNWTGPGGVAASSGNRSPPNRG